MIADGIGLAGQSQQICSSLLVGHHAEEWLERTGDWRCTRQGNADAQAEAIRQESNCRLHSRGVVGVAWGLAALGKQRRPTRLLSPFVLRFLGVSAVATASDGARWMPANQQQCEWNPAAAAGSHELGLHLHANYCNDALSTPGCSSTDSGVHVAWSVSIPRCGGN